MNNIIKEMYAFVSIDSINNDEGILGMYTPQGWIPLVGADMKRVEELLPIAKDISKMNGIKIKLKKFELLSEEDI